MWNDTRSSHLCLEVWNLVMLTFILGSRFWLWKGKSLGHLYNVWQLKARCPTPLLQAEAWFPFHVADPFKDPEAEDAGPGTKDYVHVRIQQRNGRKCLTTIQGLRKDYNYNKILKDFKKEFCCNGTVVQDLELGQVIQLQGDQRKNVSQFLINAGLVKKDKIKIHGF